MKQDKGRGVVIIGKSKCQEKCLMILEKDHFKTRDHDPTKKNEEKIQRILWKMKNRLSPQECLRLYPSGSCLGKFYGTAKVHKISEFQYGQLFQTLELQHIFGKVLSKAFLSA